MRSHSDGVRSDVYRIPMLIGESESLYNCKMHDLSSFSQRYHFLNRLLGVMAPLLAADRAMTEPLTGAWPNWRKVVSVEVPSAASSCCFSPAANTSGPASR